jgi:hypothetical protein
MAIAGLLRQAGWIINDKRVRAYLRREGLNRKAAQARQALANR